MLVCHIEDSRYFCLTHKLPRDAIRWAAPGLDSRQEFR